MALLPDVFYVKKCTSGRKPSALVVLFHPAFVADFTKAFVPESLTKKIKAAGSNGGRLPAIPLKVTFEPRVNLSGKLISATIEVPARPVKGSVKFSPNRNPKGFYQVAASYPKISQTNGRELREDLSDWTPVNFSKATLTR